MFLNCPKLISGCRSSGGRSFWQQKSLCRQNCSVSEERRVFCSWLIVTSRAIIIGLRRLLL